MTARPEWCERADVIGYQIAKGKAAVDCALANTGNDWMPLWVIACLVAVAFGAFGVLITHPRWWG